MSGLMSVPAVETGASADRDAFRSPHVTNRTGTGDSDPIGSRFARTTAGRLTWADIALPKR